MASKVYINPNLKARLEKKIDRAQLLLDSKIVGDMSTFTPWRTGKLEESAYKNLGSGIITNRVVYGRRQYYGVGFNYNKSHNPQATHHWFEKAKVLYKPSWKKLVQDEMKKDD